MNKVSLHITLHYRLLDQTSYNPTTPHKAATVRALTKRVQTAG